MTGQSRGGESDAGPLSAGAAEASPAARVIGVAEAAGDGFDLFEQPVVALGSGVGQPGAQEGQDRRPTCLDRRGEAEQLGVFGVGAPAVEPVEQGPDLGVIGVVAGNREQLAEFLFGDVGGQDLSARGIPPRPWRHQL